MYINVGLHISYWKATGIFTDHVRSMRESIVFTDVCHSVSPHPPPYSLPLPFPGRKRGRAGQVEKGRGHGRYGLVILMGGCLVFYTKLIHLSFSVVGLNIWFQTTIFFP